MDDHRDPRDEKEALGQTAKALRDSLDLSQSEVERRLGFRRGRISAIENGNEGSPELIRQVGEGIGYRVVHVARSIDLFERLAEDRRRPFDPIGPTPEQEVEIYEAGKALGAELEAMYRGRIRRENLKQALDTAAGQWGELKDPLMSRRRAEIRRNADFHTWAFCLFLCEESIRWATDQPKGAPHVARIAVVVARCCALPWVERLVAYALAHLANTYRVLGRHRKAELLFGKANRLWSLPGAAAADPGVLDPGRIYHLEAALRKDQRKPSQALALLERAFELGRDRGRVLIHRALVLSLLGSYEEAIRTLQNADTLLEDRKPRDAFNHSMNMGVNLCHLNKYDRAAEFSDAALKIAESRIDILRSRWLRARVLAGQGDRLSAVDIYRNLVEEFAQCDMTYDLALVTLELAALLLALGLTHECRFITLGLPSYFEAKRIYPEALAALKLFYDSILQETATEELARQVAAFLYLAEGNRDLRFVPVRS